MMMSVPVLSFLTVCNSWRNALMDNSPQSTSSGTYMSTVYDSQARLVEQNDEYQSGMLQTGLTTSSHVRMYVIRRNERNRTQQQRQQNDNTGGKKGVMKG